jgi:DNA polymerase-3 subunit gamma/tau
LSAHIGESVRLEFVTESGTSAAAAGTVELTPARREALVADERQRAAEQAIESDPAVRAMREVFGATIRPGSVKPIV